MISIVMSYYNRKNLLYNTLKVFNKEYKNYDYEVVIVDDASDIEYNILNIKELTKIFPNIPSINLIRINKEKKVWCNPCIPFNRGFKEAKGDIIVIQNPECIHYNNVLEYVNNNLKETNYLTFGCYSLNLPNTHRLLYNQDNLNFNLLKELITFNNKSALTNGDESWYNHSIYRKVGYHFCSAITKDNLMSFGGFDEDYANGIGYDDNDLLLKIRHKGLIIEVIDNPTVLHQNHYDEKYFSDKTYQTKNNQQIFLAKCRELGLT